MLANAVFDGACRGSSTRRGLRLRPTEDVVRVQINLKPAYQFLATDLQGFNPIKDTETPCGRLTVCPGRHVELSYSSGKPCIHGGGEQVLGHGENLDRLQEHTEAGI